MKPIVYYQSALLLLLGQMLLGGIGYLLRVFAWWGLPLVVLLLWFVVRTAVVLRQETALFLERRRASVPWPWILRILVIWQLPTVLTLPYWTPSWMSHVWQGVWLPVLGTLARFWPDAAVSVEPWLWLAFLIPTVLFLATAAAPAASARAKAPLPPAPTEPGQWAPARRHMDIAPREGGRLRVK